MIYSYLIICDNMVKKTLQLYKHLMEPARLYCNLHKICVYESLDSRAGTNKTGLNSKTVLLVPRESGSASDGDVSEQPTPNLSNHSQVLGIRAKEISPSPPNKRQKTTGDRIAYTLQNLVDGQKQVAQRKTRSTACD